MINSLFVSSNLCDRCDHTHSGKGGHEVHNGGTKSTKDSNKIKFIYRDYH